MKVDLYVKVVLTVIAVCLVVIAIKPVFVTPVEAKGQVIDVNIVKLARHMFGCKDISYVYNGLPVYVTNASEMRGK